MESPCLGIVPCRNTQGGYECVCESGYEWIGSECTGTLQNRGRLEKEKTCLSYCHVLMITDINECIQEPCGDQDQARCSNSIGSYICFCDIIGYGWNGTACAGKAFVS